MTREELNRVLDLQHKAYNLLLWIDEQARHQPDLLSEKNVEAWRSAASCEDWVRRMIGIFPRDLRPEENYISTFSHLMSSFFNTSFRVEEKSASDWHGRYDPYTVERRRRLLAGVSSTREYSKDQSAKRENTRIGAPSSTDCT